MNAYAILLAACLALIFFCVFKLGRQQRDVRNSAETIVVATRGIAFAKVICLVLGPILTFLLFSLLQIVLFHWVVIPTIAFGLLIIVFDFAKE